MNAAATPNGGYRPRCEPREETLRLRGLDIHARRWGPAPDSQTPGAILLHGWLDTGDSFQFLVDAMTLELPLIAIDWRGFGRSAWPQDGYWFPDYLADLEALLDRVAPRAPAILIGHSMGGNVASLYAGIRPERVRAVINLEGFGLARTRPQDAPGRLRQWLDELRAPAAANDYAGFDQLATVIRRRHPRIRPDRADHLARAWGCVGADGRVSLRGDPRHRRVNPILYRREEAEACWREIRAPYLLISGDDSAHVLPHGIEALAAPLRGLIADFQLARIEAAGHLLHVEQPEAVAQAIDRFLAAH